MGDGTESVSVFWKVGHRVLACFGRWDRECQCVLEGGTESVSVLWEVGQRVSVLWKVGQRV